MKEVADVLVCTYPDGLKEETDNGDLPLHRAIVEGVSMEVVEILLNGYIRKLRGRGM